MSLIKEQEINFMANYTMANLCNRKRDKSESYCNRLV